MRPRSAVSAWTASNVDDLLEELRTISRRGEVFLFMTDDAAAASQAAAAMPRLPGGFWPIDVLKVDDDPRMSDEFVFASLWFGRASFVAASPERAPRLIDHVLERLAERRRTRARTRQTVHLIWDLPTPIPDSVQQRFARLGAATGYRLVVRAEQEAT